VPRCCIRCTTKERASAESPRFCGCSTIGARCGFDTRGGWVGIAAQPFAHEQKLRVLRITLAAVARDDGFETFTHPERITSYY
jgi:hypothetical protein